MLSIAPQEFQPQQQPPYYYLPYRTHSSMSVSHSHRLHQPAALHHHQHAHEVPFFAFSASPLGTPPGIETMPAPAAQDASVAQALEIARESPDGSSDPTISKILEGALTQIWTKVQAQPNSYVMTRDEFAVFNFFQHRFTGDKTAVSARKRYWDNARA